MLIFSHNTEYDRSQIFDIKIKPKTSILKIRPLAKGLSLSRSYGFQEVFPVNRTGTDGIDRTLSYSAKVFT